MIWQILAVLTVSFLTCLLLLKAGRRYVPMDHPNHRSMHAHSVPRVGGIAIAAGVLVGMVAIWPTTLHRSAWLIAFASLLLAAIAFWDDRADVSPVQRLIVQAVAACCLLLALYPLPGFPRVFFMGWTLLLVVAAVLGIVWSINLYNFMDGMDGLAAMMAIIGFSCLGWFGWQAGQMTYASMALTIVAACLGFLPFNIHPAKMFMGDVGSTLLGFWAAGFSLWGILLELYPWWVPLLLFSPFWVDASVTLIGRILRKENVLQAHKSHLYQRLVRLGLGQRGTLLLEVVVMLTCALLAISASNWPSGGQLALLLGLSIAYASFFRIATLS